MNSIFQNKPPVLPRHVAVIMDGNGRWANRRFLPRNAGHKAGSRVFREIAGHAEKLGIRYITFYVFSTENWKRPREEVDALMGLLEEHLKECLADYRDSDKRAVFLGDKGALPAAVRKLMTEVEEQSRAHTGLCVCLAVNYGARAEITHAVKKIAARVNEKTLALEEIGEPMVADSLYTAGIPDVDLLIRTGGEIRLSNFLLWQAAYAEMVFVKKLWPDFRPADLEAAVREFARRNRRFGGV